MTCALPCLRLRSSWSLCCCGAERAAACAPADTAPIQARRRTTAGTLSGNTSCRKSNAAADSNALAASAKTSYYTVSKGATKSTTMALPGNRHVEF